jgi:hypothetical protein
MSKLLSLAFLLALSPLSHAESLIKIDLTVGLWSEYSEELDYQELLAEGWRIAEFPERGPEDFSEEDFEELDDVEWIRIIEVKSSDLSTPKNYIIGDAILSINAKGEVALEFESGDNLARGSVTLPQNSEGEFLPLNSISLNIRGNDNSTWYFFSEAKISVKKLGE